MNLQYNSTGASTASNIYSSVKLNYINVFTPIALTSTYNSVAIEWTGLQSPSKEVTVTGTAFKPAHRLLRPPNLTTAGFWHASGSIDELFTISVSGASAIIDINISFVIMDFDNTQLRTVLVGSGLYPGNIYTNTYLDNPSIIGTSAGVNYLKVQSAHLNSAVYGH